MLVTTATPVVFSTLFLSSATLAAPTRTRTYCRCTIVTNAPSITRWTPEDQSPGSTAADICTDLGPELENFRHAKPDLYETFLRDSVSASSSGASRPIPTSVLVNMAAHKGFQRSQEDQENEPRPTSRPNQRIVCNSEFEPISAYESSHLHLWALQFIIAFSILACVAEGVQLGVQWMNQRNNKNNNNNDWQITQESAVRLSGEEKRLLAHPSSSPTRPSIDESTSQSSSQSSNGGREFLAYEDDDDDEVNRPVM